MNASSFRGVRRLVVLLAILPGCGDSSASDSGVTVDTLANGAVLVSSPEGGVWDSGEGWTLAPDLTIGTLMEEGPASFAQISSLAVDPAGRIYVGENRAREIRVFNPDGSHLRTLGRDGSGPGEFRQIQGMGWGPDGNLWVLDGQNGFVSYDTAGTYVGGRARNNSFAIFPWPGRFDSGGGVIDVGPPGEDLRYHLIRYTNDFQRADTIRIPEVPSDAFEHAFPNGGRVSYTVPYSSRLAYHLDHEGNLWSGNTAEYRLYQQGLGGDTVRAVERAFTPVPVAATEKAAAIEGLQSFVSQGGTIDPGRIPANKPAFESINSDDRGFLWVRPSLPEELANTFAADVFDSDGTYLGRVQAPVRIMDTPKPVIIGDRMIAVVRDSLDVQSVQRFRIEGREL